MRLMPSDTGVLDTYTQRINAEKTQRARNALEQTYRVALEQTEETDGDGNKLVDFRS